VLQIAKDWGVPPWTIVQKDQKALWILRKRIFDSEVESAQKAKEIHNRKKAGK
jgi:hypothetical protein